MSNSIGLAQNYSVKKTDKSCKAKQKSKFKKKKAK